MPLPAMDIYNHFSCYTKLPILIEDVIAHVIDAEVVDEILIYPLEMDPTHLRGFCWVFKDKPKNAANHRRVAWIGYSNKLPREMARLTICKELLHLLDEHYATARTAAEVSQLIDEIVLPAAAHIALHALQDSTGELRALAVMMPACAIEEFREGLAEGQIGHDTIAKHARLPEEHIRLAFSPAWDRILELFGISRKPDDEPGLPLANPAE